ncbi:MAG TPA: DNA alkylation repair protein [Sunxiuqinia sp.]|nr:DNA alkylation repair protein [Sunxiuqinia sp.]
MTNNEIVNILIEDLKKASSARHNTKGVTPFTTHMKWLGVSAPQLKSIVKNWRPILFDFSPERWIEVCLLLCMQGIFECQILAYEILWKVKPALKALTKEQILELGSVLDNWVSTDAYCTMIAGWHWREGTLPDSQIKKWLKSDDRWLRRVGVVCTIPLNLKAKGGTGNTGRTLMVCERVIDDRDDMVVKALSWALRELSKSDKAAVENFMRTHWERLHGRVRREVTTKLETGRKNG